MTAETFTAACLLIGVFAGFLGGLLGVGGGVIVVPALLCLFQVMDLFPADRFAANSLVLAAIATSMSTIVFTTGVSSFAQMRRKTVDWHAFRHWVFFVAAGSLAASLIARLVNVAALEFFIGGFLMSVAITLLTDWHPRSSRTWPRPIASGAIAGTAGLISGLAGIGGANVVVPALVYFNFPMVRAAATASALGFFVACFGTLGYIAVGWSANLPDSIGYVYLPAAIPIACASMLFAPLGVSLGHRLSSRTLSRIFGVLIAFVSGRLILEAVL